MAFTQADADRLRQAIASGVLSVRAPDGRMVTYQSVEAMMRALAAVEADLGQHAAKRTTLASFARD